MRKWGSGILSACKRSARGGSVGHNCQTGELQRLLHCRTDRRGNGGSWQVEDERNGPSCGSEQFDSVTDRTV